MNRKSATYIWLFCLLLASIEVEAVPLPPEGGFSEHLLGTSIAARPELAGTTIVEAEETRQFTGVDPSNNIVLRGTLYTRVVRETATGTLDFYYQINNDLFSTGITDIGTSNFSGFILDADFRNDLGAGVEDGSAFFLPNPFVNTVLFGPFITSPILQLNPSGYMAGFDFGFATPGLYIAPGEKSHFLFIRTNATQYVRGRTFIFSGLGNGGLAEVDSYAPGPQLVPETILATPARTQYDGFSCVQESPTATHLVMITHGWNSHAKVKPFPDDNWVVGMANSIKTLVNLNQANPSDWNICVYDWEEAAHTTWPSTLVATSPAAKVVWGNAALIGDPLGLLLFNRGYTHIHFIAHSAGSNLIQKAVNRIIGEYGRLHGSPQALCVTSPASAGCSLPKPIIHSTFLDAYVPYDITDYGMYADWAEQYFAIGTPYTNVALPSAYNFDVSNIPHDGGLYDDHAWPHYWYSASINQAYPYGFSTSLESGRAELPKHSTEVIGKKYYPRFNQYPKGYNNNPCDLTLPDQCGIDGSIPPTPKQTTQTNLYNQVDIQNLQSTSQIAMSATGITTITSPTSMQSGTGSPVWVSMFVSPASSISTLEFDYGFESTAEGQLSVFFDGNLVFSADERYTLAGNNHASGISLGNAVPGTHTLSFRLDPFTTTQSVINIANIKMGSQSVLTAAAGSGQTVYVGRTVSLDGSGSADSRGVPLTYSWSQNGDPAAALSDPAAVNPTFSAPPVSVSGQKLTFLLTVTNSEGTSATDTVTTTVVKLGDVDIDGDVDRDDLNLVLAARNTAASDPNDLRDLDGDGMITALDARKLTTLCTRPRCATQ